MSNKRYFIKDGVLYSEDELMHAGVKGMRWGFHLPGTTWWKATKDVYKTALNNNRGNTITRAVKDSNGNSSSISTKKQPTLRNRLNAFGEAARFTGRYVKSGARRSVNRAKRGLSKLYGSARSKFETLAKNAYEESRNFVHSFFDKALSTNLKNAQNDMKPTRILNRGTHLDSIMDSEWGDAVKAYSSSKVKGGFGNTVNSFIQTSQWHIVSGVNNFLKNIGLDDEVDDFLSKFMGESNRIQRKNQREAERMESARRRNSVRV